MSKRAAKYKRISRDREGLALGVERQDEDLDALADRLDLVVVADYCDNDLGASTRSRKPRPDYRRMLADARAGRFDVILAYTSGRITRRPRENEDLIELAEQHGITFEYMRSPSFDLNTSAGRRIARILAANDAGEAEDIAERVQRQKDQAAAAGLWKGGRRPYGYEDDGMTVRESEAAVIDTGTDAVIAGGSLRGLAAEWNRGGLVTSTGKPWRQDTVRKVLIRPRNAGLMEHRGQVIGPASWPAIVDEDRWRACVAILEDPGRRTQWSSARRWLLSGIALCDVCGAPVLCTQVGGSRLKPSYTCRKGRHVVRNAAELDEYVDAVVVERLSRKDAADLLVRSKADGGKVNDELHALRKRRRSLSTLLTEGVLTEDEVRRDARRLDERIAELDAASVASGADGALVAILLADNPARAYLDVKDLDRRRAIVDALMTIRIKRAGRGRPKGWKSGQSYFDPRTVQIIPK
ncbi:recombinase family protein [Micromonospora sp. WMMA1363]|uniref:recombinase family protein n=1 Tax=Micromonospora sp. WMMA1363 TaxID=3053985 RepID=UPI00259CACE2|nr:recombinase family protein [Micromonospora sp. WMMA1363]MDM4720141.1 recombinase family protein [Micromonospora sp. WMMA1363]MDM4723001.1 recombinase family protein [Micromonospora sp. WMMA1363]